LVTVGGKQLLFDAGRGVTIRLAQLGIPFGKIDAVFLTHYHSDHINGLADIWMTSYLPPAFAHRTSAMRLWGPKGISRIADNLMTAYADDIRIRIADEHVPEIATKIEAHEYQNDGVVFDEDGVKVTAFEVNHGPLIKPAFGYRVDFAGHAVTISGDTKFNENVIKHGTGADLLIHEVMLTPEALMSNPVFIAIMNHHTSPEEAGTVFARAKPKLAAYTHLVMFPPVTPDEIATHTRRNYQGPLAMGEDLMRFIIAENVTVQKWDPQRKGYPT
jgi:ribonuclease Z